MTSTLQADFIRQRAGPAGPALFFPTAVRFNQTPARNNPKRVSYRRMWVTGIGSVW